MFTHCPRRSFLVAATLVASLLTLQGCDKAVPPADPHQHTGDGHDHDHDHDHADAGDHHDGGAVVELGTQKARAYEIRASRDGEIKAGGEAPIDLWVTGGPVSAVRLWIGTEDAKGSIKVKAELKKDNWHSHAEVPSPLPAGSKLWVEIESDKSERTLVSFELKSP